MVYYIVIYTSGSRPQRGQRAAGQESGDDDEGRPMRRRVRRPVADTAVYIGNVPKTVRISEFKAKVSFHGAVVQYLSCLTLYVMTKV